MLPDLRARVDIQQTIGRAGFENGGPAVLQVDPTVMEKRDRVESEKRLASREGRTFLLTGLAVPLEIDFDALANTRDSAYYSKIFYYDAVPLQDPQESEADFQARIAQITQEHAELRALDRFHVWEGDLRRSSRQDRRQQKKIDVMIAVDLLTHAFRRNMHKATLLASDLDFEPLVHALVHEGMFIDLWYPPSDTHADLVAAADTSRRLEDWQLLDVLKGSSIGAIGGAVQSDNISQWKGVKVVLDKGDCKLLQRDDGWYGLQHPWSGSSLSLSKHLNRDVLLTWASRFPNFDL